MIELHYYPSNASMAAHILLEELQIPFSLKLVDRSVDAHKSAHYLRLNPNGLIPVLIDGDVVLYEAVAICLHLIDTQSHPALAPALGTPQRAHFYKWLIWLTNTLQAALLAYFYPERWVDQGNEAGAKQVRHHAQFKISGMLKQLDDQLASHGKPWLMGERYSVVDIYMFMLCRWTRGFTGSACKPARDWPHLGPHMNRMLARPAVQRVIKSEKLAPPLI